MIDLIPLFIAIPLGTAFIVVLTAWKFKKLADIFASLAALSLLVLSGLFLIAGSKGIYNIGNWLPPIGINLYIDDFTLLMLLIVNLVSFAATVYSISYMKQYTAKYKYYGLFLLMVSGQLSYLLHLFFYLRLVLWLLSNPAQQLRRRLL